MEEIFNSGVEISVNNQLFRLVPKQRAKNTIIMITIFTEKSVFKQQEALLFTNREWHRHHISSIVHLPLMTVPVKKKMSLCLTKYHSMKTYPCT